MSIFGNPFSGDLRHSRLVALPASRAARIAPGLVAIAAVGLFAATSLADVQALVGEANGNLTQLDITTGTSSTLRNAGVAVLGLAYHPTETTLYGAVANSVADPSSLVNINQTTGAYTVIGAHGVDLATLTNLSDGRLFGVDVEDNLYQVNPSNGAASLIGPTGLSSTGTSDFSLASNGTTLYYTYSANGGVSSLYTLSLSTGAATTVGSTGVSGIVGSAFAGPTFATGSLYEFLTNGQTDSINLSTGAATFVNDNGLGDIYTAWASSRQRPSRPAHCSSSPVGSE